MAVRSAEAKWSGTLQEGKGNVKLESGAFEGAYSFSSRFEEGTGTNPEELLGAAHAACYSMALNAALGRADFTPEYVKTTAKVHMVKTDAGLTITKIDLITEAKIPDIDDATFQEHAEGAKTGCIISRALSAVEMSLEATLV
ncbi:MAG: OsmC family protein [Aggregatilineales bacterium]